MLVLSLHSADDTEVEEEEMIEDDDDEDELEEEVDSDVFPSMMIITLFSAGVPSAQQHSKPDQSQVWSTLVSPFSVSPVSWLLSVATLFFSVGLRGRSL